MATIDIDPHLIVKANAFTTKTYRDIYPSIDLSHSELSQDGKVVITGASRGLGRLVRIRCFLPRANAAAIVLIGRSAADPVETEKLVKESNSNTKVLSIAVDATNEVGVKTALQEIVARFGVPHVLINNAGTLASLNRIQHSALNSRWQTQVGFSSARY
ncbi:hypothetical protein SI65_03726 [Aspergillus cristatus]|uniref:Ketoreductase (KR) domain-containing protein n=1 Tax=Aspergillus cristatus TaxID=573508 RepID=A0A1E3BI80_ASPCR|nr:hypothetical protein SI65_03726 [Aspergillus cristatus]